MPCNVCRHGNLRHTSVFCPADDDAWHLAYKLHDTHATMCITYEDYMRAWLRNDTILHILISHPAIPIMSDTGSGRHSLRSDRICRFAIDASPGSLRTKAECR
eukprot:2769944-Amphidinium_carterae.1